MIRSTMLNKSGASFLLCSLGWRAIEEENEGERYERKRRKISESLGGIFGIFQIFWSVFLKKHLSSDSLKITLSVFPDFWKCFLKLPNTLFSSQKHLKVFSNGLIILVAPFSYWNSDDEVIVVTSPWLLDHGLNPLFLYFQEKLKMLENKVAENIKP